MLFFFTLNSLYSKVLFLCLVRMRVIFPELLDHLPQSCHCFEDTVAVGGARPLDVPRVVLGEIAQAQNVAELGWTGSI